MESNDPRVIQQDVDARRRVEESTLAAAAAAAPEVTGPFVHDCLIANERGDGTLFAALQKGRLIFNKTSGRWYRWADHHWDIDVFEDCFRVIEDVSMKYIDAGEALVEEIKEATEAKKTGLAAHLQQRHKEFFRRVRRLRSTSGAQNCLSWAHRVEEGLSTREEELDRNPWLLACRNGVVELKTARFRPGRPGDLLVKAVPHDWTGIDSPAPSWESFLDQIFDGNRGLIDYVQRLLGYGITGLAREHVFAVFYGEEGRNGKGTLVETIKYILGPLAQPIQSEMLLDQKNTRSSSGPSPDIMSLKGNRMVFASETDESRRFSPARVKWLSGGDSLVGRNPNDKYETVFDPTHLLFLLTNHLPHAPGDDLAFWARVHLIPFKLRFVDSPSHPNERPRDKDLPDKLRAEAAGILAWLVRGCIEWQRQGLNPPPIVLSATEEYRMNEDILGGFIEDCCYPPQETDPDLRTKFGDLYDAFEAWFLKNKGDYCPKKKKFGDWVKKRFKKEHKGGQIWFYGLALLPYPHDDEETGGLRP